MIIGKIWRRPAFGSAKLVGMTPAMYTSHTLLCHLKTRRNMVLNALAYLLRPSYLTQNQNVTSSAFYVNDSPLKMRGGISGHITKNHK